MVKGAAATSFRVLVHGVAADSADKRIIRGTRKLMAWTDSPLFLLLLKHSPNFQCMPCSRLGNPCAAFDRNSLLFLRYRSISAGWSLITRVPLKYLLGLRRICWKPRHGWSKRIAKTIGRSSRRRFIGGKALYRTAGAHQRAAWLHPNWC